MDEIIKAYTLNRVILLELPSLCTAHTKNHIYKIIYASILLTFKTAQCS